MEALVYSLFAFIPASFCNAGHEAAGSRLFKRSST
jgi:hypothetical protein